jgi:tetratricopeptide (TPR) repeat protein
MHGWHATFDQSGAAAMTTQPCDATPGLTPELGEAIRLGYAQRDRANMGPTIAYFESLLAKHPGHPVLVYEVAGAYDTAGQEEKARELYERALDLGLAGDTLRRCLCQYGSTLRWLGQYDKSLAALDRARKEWPESDAVRVFRALTLNDAGRSDEAVAELMTVITAHADVTDLGRWAEGLSGLAQWLADGRPDSLFSPATSSGRSRRASGCARFASAFRGCCVAGPHQLAEPDSRRMRSTIRIASSSVIG